MTALLVITGIVIYLLAAFATGGYVYYSQMVYPERWRGYYGGGYMPKEDRQVHIALGAIFWPVAWLLFIPACAATRLADRIASRAIARRKIAEADAREVENAMRELER